MLKLAINGGAKGVKIAPPHWQWPLKYDDELEAIINQYKFGKGTTKGIPEIVDKLENEFAAYHGVKYGLALSSATACLHTAFFACGVSQGVEVLAPTYTFPATITPVFQLGGIPILCDCFRENGNIMPQEIEKKITKKTKVLVITHLWGHPCEMDEIMKLVKKYKIFLIEDCSHSHLATYKNRLVGTFGDIAVFSFDNQKMPAAGEAGLLITNNQELYERCIVFSDFCGRNTTQVSLKKYLNFKESGLGIKYRIHPLGAAQAYFKFKKLPELNAMRAKMLNYFSERLKETKSIVPPKIKEYCTMGAWYGYKPFYNKIMLSANCKIQGSVTNMKNKKSELNIQEYIKILNAEGVDVRQTVTPPLHKTFLFNKIKEVYKICPNFAVNKISDYPRYKAKDFPNAEWYYKNHLSFPTFTFEKDKKIIDEYIEAIKKVEKLING
ncbi:MAG TPA: aminotransferase class I/II-fold pyridoxal phosphate-dependent enzyme [bacterium]|nr:aminotransferase class I/II-fold pyridoxal phosphate-dependent enzyme [bacterium]HPQ20072.1 aminotransferase class I/II-fold pyridoxal phosphate-dependent enzyme [bacterium]